MKFQLWIFVAVVVFGGIAVVGQNNVIDMQALFLELSSSMKYVRENIVACTSVANRSQAEVSGMHYNQNDLGERLQNVSSSVKDLSAIVATCGQASSQTWRDKPRDCAQLWRSGVRTDGVQRIWPEAWQTVGSFEVYCDMTTDGGGWTVFQRRGDHGNPRDYFFRNWTDYKNGFGQLDKEFWLGNDRIFALTNQDTYELRVDLWDMDNATAYAKYGSFWIENEDQQYRLKIGRYSGTSGDNLHVSGAKFTTRDRRNDVRTDGHNCAELYKGAWWYTSCHSSNLNGLNLRGTHQSYADGINWEHFKGYHYSLSATEMKIRPLYHGKEPTPA